MTTSKRELLMLAHTFDPAKHGIAGCDWSEKLDGERCWWDGGITTGLPKAMVPWANTEKDGRYKDEQFCTGLWTRYGNVIHAPAWWIKTLPKIPMDGEMWVRRGPGGRQELMRIIKTLVPGPDWAKVKFKVFDMPPYEAVLEPGRIYTPTFSKQITGDAYRFASRYFSTLALIPDASINFEAAQYHLKKLLSEYAGYASFHEQHRLPYSTPQAQEILDAAIEDISSKEGEGIIIRKPNMIWTPKRVHTMLKIKKLSDSEGVVVGYTTGRKTDKGSKLLGKMGALIITWEGKTFELSGFTDAERQLVTVGGDRHAAEDWACQNPEARCPSSIWAEQFPTGTVVTFQYRDVTADGIPQEARYWRKNVSA